MYNYLRLMRPANILTAMTDILSGFAVSGLVISLAVGDLDSWMKLAFLLLSTIGLYGGGVVFNDVFDAKLDKVERPERPIPSGKVSLRNAALLGSGLLLLGIIAAFRVSVLSGVIASLIAVLALLYDKFSKHHAVIGPVNMGMCRGGNLLLGVSAVPLLVQDFWILAIIPVTYIAMITMISRGEVHGGSKLIISGAVVLYVCVVLYLIALTILPQYILLSAFPFLVFFIYLTLPSLYKAWQNPEAQQIRKAVKGGILALIVMDAAVAAGFAGIWYGLAVLCFLPLSFVAAKKFAVT